MSEQKKKTAKKKTPAKKKVEKVDETVKDNAANDETQASAGEQQSLQRAGQGASVSDILRSTRLSHKLELEDVSSAINVRVSQLRAIEEGKFDALPGKTYVLGFIRSYATHLGLDGADIVQKFKVEHGGINPIGANLHAPEPLPDGPQANMLVIGSAVFCALVVLAFWAVFSDGGEVTEVADVIPEAPVVASVTGLSTTSAESAVVPSLVQPEAAMPTPVQSALAGSNLLSAAAPVSTPSVVAPPEKTNVVQPAPEIEAVESASAPVLKPAIKPPPVERNATINVRSNSKKGRIVLKAVQSSWIEVKDAKGGTVFKKLLREGEEYAPPEGTGYTLVTTNAGGLGVYVDGEQVQSLGRQGEILRGIELDPDELKTVKIRALHRRSGGRR